MACTAPTVARIGGSLASITQICRLRDSSKRRRRCATCGGAEGPLLALPLSLLALPGRDVASPNMRSSSSWSKVSGQSELIVDHTVASFSARTSSPKTKELQNNRFMGVFGFTSGLRGVGAGVEDDLFVTRGGKLSLGGGPLPLPFPLLPMDGVSGRGDTECACLFSMCPGSAEVSPLLLPLPLELCPSPLWGPAVSVATATSASSVLEQHLFGGLPMSRSNLGMRSFICKPVTAIPTGPGSVAAEDGGTC
mmetsp:Transcript_103106/g.204763  ORF Transcript_103106/g.204763 Transcript_103106/m.204763 type:complete len:251 (+) Transcript_103106:1010-1762(+)